MSRSSDGRAARCWLRRGPAVIDEPLGEFHAVFDPMTGETHFLNELPAMVLSVVDGKPRTPSALIDRLAGSDDLEEHEREQIFLALEFLEAAELVESGLPKAT